MNVLATAAMTASPVLISFPEAIFKLDGILKMLFVFAGLAIIILLIILFNLRGLLKRELVRSNWKSLRGLRPITRNSTIKLSSKDLRDYKKVQWENSISLGGELE